MGAGQSLCTYGNQADIGTQCVVGGTTPLKCPGPSAAGAGAGAGADAAGKVSDTFQCDAKKNTGYWVGQVAMNLIPFFGPGLAAFFSPPNTTQKSLQDAQVALADAQCQLKSLETSELAAITTNICELELTLFGSATTCGYVQIAIDQASLPVNERASLLAINVAFLAIIVICLVVLM